MPNAGYAFTSAYLKGEEARFVTSDHVDGMAKASSVQDALESVRETDIGSYLEGMSVKTFDDLDRYLWSYLGECLERLEWFKTVPSEIRRILEAYVVKYDVLNIKAALMAISNARKARLLPIGVIHNRGLLDELADAESVGGIIELLNGCKLGNYAAILEEYNVDEGARSRRLTEVKLDGEYYRNLLEVAKGVKDGAVLSQAFGTMIDMINLQLILRAVIGNTGAEAAEYVLGGGYIISDAFAKELISLKLNDIPGRLANTQYHDVVEEVVSGYDRTRSVTAVEEVIEKHKFRLSQETLSPRVLSPLMAAWYLILKELEIRNLRLILKSIFDNRPVEEIKDYLVLAS